MVQDNGMNLDAIFNEYESNESSLYLARFIVAGKYVNYWFRILFTVAVCVVCVFFVWRWLSAATTCASSSDATGFVFRRQGK